MKKALAALLIAALTLMGCALAEEASMPELIEPVGVRLDTAKVVRQDIYNMSYYDAAVVPYTEELSFTVDGKIDTVTALVGDVVKKGDVLATLDQTDDEEQAENLRQQIDYLETELAFAKRSDKLTLESAQLELEQLKAQAKSGGATDADVKLKQADVDILKLSQQQARESDEFAIASLRRQLASVEEKLGDNTIAAPFDGRIVYMQQVEKGTWMKAYDPLFYIADDTRLSIDSAYISASVTSSANEVYARVNGVDCAITAQELNWREYVTIALSGGELRSGFDFVDGAPEGTESGMYATVFVKSGLVEDALVVPANAIYTDEGGRYVYLIDGDTRTRQAVSTGRFTTTLVQITDGLKEGDLVYVKE